MKKRRPTTDLSVEEEALAPARKVARQELREDGTLELVQPEQPINTVKKPTRSIKEAKKLHKERVRVQKRGDYTTSLYEASF